MTPIVLVAVVYIYFLLFAQFALLHGLHAVGASQQVVHGTMAVMALAGISASLATPGLVRVLGVLRVLGVGLLAAAAGAALAAVAFANPRLAVLGTFVGSAVLAGAGVALATVALAGGLRRMCRGRRIGLTAGAGTALAYGFCNLPWVFASDPTSQSVIAVAIATAGGCFALVRRDRFQPDLDHGDDAGKDLVRATWGRPAGVAAAIAAFAALVWFDSAAFAAIQMNPDQLSRFWSGASTLWTNGLAHMAGALAVGWLLDLGAFGLALPAAFAALVLGAHGFHSNGWITEIAAPIYAIGVSIYSTALAAWPALLADRPGRIGSIHRAAWLYAVAGWAGSVLGVGLAESRGMLPAWTAVVAGGLLAAAGALVMLRDRLATIDSAPR